MRLGTVVYQGKARVVAALDEGTLLDLAKVAGDNGAIFADMVALGQ